MLLLLRTSICLAFEDRPVLIELIPRLAVSGSLPEDEEILERILAVGGRHPVVGCLLVSQARYIPMTS